MVSELVASLERAKALGSELKYNDATMILRSVINSGQYDGDLDPDVVGKIKEKAINRLGKYLVQLGQSNELAALLKSLRPFFTTIPKAKTAKIVRYLIELQSQLPKTDELIIELCNDHIAWANQEGRIILRQRLEFKLSQSYYRVKEYQLALKLISRLIYEIKRLDDKPMLVETYLLESKIHHGLLNFSKARASLSAARTCANSIYCPPNIQADLDTHSGILHCEEKDYKTAYSYFFEAFENYNHSVKERTIKLFTDGGDNESTSKLVGPQSDDLKMSFKDRYYFGLGTKCLKYMLMCKIMSNIKDDVHTLINGKLALRYATADMEAMRMISSAYSEASIRDFRASIDKYKSEIEEDDLLKRHLTNLYETLLEQNLLKLIEPYSQVQLGHISSLIEIPPILLEKKLSQMIVDKKLDGILDQGADCLIIFDEAPRTDTFQYTLDAISEMGKIVDTLYNKAKNLS